MLNFDPTNVQEMKEAMIYVIDDLIDIYSRSNPPASLVIGKEDWLNEQCSIKEKLVRKVIPYLGKKRIKFLFAIVDLKYIKKEGTKYV